MALYRLHRMKDAPRQQFRWAAHSSGVTQAKPKDYELTGEFDAPSAYALWQNVRLTDQSLQLGDILELESGELRIFKYVGFEEAQWVIVEPKAGGPGTLALVPPAVEQPAHAG